MKYVFADILRIRKIRIDKAQKEVALAQQKLSQSIKILEKKQQELIDFQKKKPLLVEKLYAKVIKKNVFKSGVDNLKAELANLDATELQFQEALTEAKKQVQAAEKALEKTKKKLQQCFREAQKIDEHKVIWTAERAREDEITADKELEDFKPKT